MHQSVIPSRTWDIHHSTHEQSRRKWIASRTPVPLALDIGCAYGYMTSAIPALDVVAVDLSADLITKARKFWRDNFLTHITARTGDACSLPFDDNSFDAVYCSETLEHLQDPERAAREIERVTRGAIYVSVPAHGHMRSVKGHVQDFTPESLAALFSVPLTVRVEEPFTFGEAG